jgi:SAM-dependent methyltransferase
VPDHEQPPADLARRVGVLDQDDPVTSFDAMGRRFREIILELLGEDWFEPGGRRALDFGCGAGKLLLHLLDKAERNELLGCDIHEPSIRWLAEHYSPPLTVFTCAEEPGLDLPDDHLDLVLAMSVFTHLTEHWAGWLLELHRVLRPGAAFICTFLGRGMSETVAREPWDPDRIGMNVSHLWQSWDDGGPAVQHSEWWLRAHWGRAFDFEHLEDPEELGHGIMLLRKRPVSLTVQDLVAPEPGEPRELTAARHNLVRMAQDVVELGRDRDVVARELEAVRADREIIARELDAVRADRELVSEQLARVAADRDALAARLRGR